MALTTCPECTSQISDQAHACPKCGAPRKVAKKTSGCAWLALFFLAIPFLWGYLGSASRNAAEGAPAQLSDAECKKSLQCWGDRHSARAGAVCQRAVERAAEYQAEWTDGALESKFPRFGWVDQARGVLRFNGDKVKFQNGFGAWKHMVYSCTYNPDSAAAPEVLVVPR